KNSGSRVQDAQANGDDRRQERQEFRRAQEQGEQEPDQARKGCAGRKAKGRQGQGRGEERQDFSRAVGQDGGETRGVRLKNGAAADQTADRNQGEGGRSVGQNPAIGE